MKLKESELDKLKEKLRKLGLNDEETLNIIKATLLILSRKEFREREEIRYIAKLLEKYGIRAPF